MPKLLAFGCQSRVGKDAVSDYLCRFGFVKLTFAKPLHTAIDSFKTHINKLDESKYRLSMITLANEAKSTHGEDIFVDLVEEQIIKARGEGNDIVISDLRFLNEYKMLKKYGVKYIKITKQSITERSEIDDITPDYIIDNNGDLSDLYREADKILGSLC